MLPSILVILGAATISVIGMVVLTKLVPPRWLVADGDAAGALYATIGMVYAILIALGSIAVWEPRAAASESTSREATDLIEMYWSSRAFDEPERNAVQTLIVQYTNEVITAEWPSLAREREPNAHAQELLSRLRSKVETLEPMTDRQALAHDEMLSRVADAADARRARIGVASEGMPYPLWPILVFGGVVSIGFLYLFGLERTFPNGLMMFTVGGMVALLLVVIYQMEYPFSRGLSVGPQPFQDALRQFELIS